jgi:hypothetical protein
MTVTSGSDTYKLYSGDGTTHVFAYTFRVFQNTELLVLIRNNTTGATYIASDAARSGSYDPDTHVGGEGLNTAYILSGVDDPNGGNVTFKYDTNNPSDENYSTTDYRPQTGESVIIIRVPAVSQETNYVPGGAFPAESHEDALDKLTFHVQRIEDQLNKTIQRPEADTGAVGSSIDSSLSVLPDNADMKGKYLSFNATTGAPEAGATATDVVLSSSAQTLTNKSINADNNSISNLDVENFKGSAIVTEAEGIQGNDNDTTLPTSAAVKDYVDSQATGETLNVDTDGGNFALTIDSETLTFDGGAGITTSSSGTTVQIDIDASVVTLNDTQTLTNKSIDASQLTGTIDDARIPVAATDSAGLMSAADKTKMDGIETGATADQTAAEIKTAYESNSDTNAFTDADHTKLDGIEASADVTDTANVTAAGALMDSEVTNLAQVKAFDSADYATAAQGTTADAALPRTGGTMTGNIVMSASETVDGRDLSVDGAKLDGIENGATADQSASEILTAVKTVDGAASGLDADLLDGQHGSYYTGYTDTAVANLVDSAPAALDTLNELAAALGDDANFSTTVTNSIATKLPLAGGTMTGNIVMSGTETVDGRDLSVDGAKLDGIESGATADQTAAEIRTLVESATDSNVFTDADHTKLNGIEASADVTDTANVTAAGALMDSEVTNLAQVKAFDSSDYATAAQGTTADAAMPKAGGAFTGDVTFTGDSYNVVWDKSDNALELADNAYIKVGAGDDMTIRSDGTYPRIRANNIIVESNNADQSIYFRSNDTGDIADFDTGTQFYFQQYNDNNEIVTYNRLLSISTDVTDGSEDGRFQFQSLKNGANTTSLIVDASNLLIMNDQALGWYTYNGDFSTYLSPLTPTADRSIRLPDRDGVVQVVDRQVMTSNLAVGWHTIAVFQGRDDSGDANQRFHAKFTLLEYTSSRHQAFTFYAQSMFGQDEGLQVIGNSTFGTDVVTAIRIKSSTDALGLYAGAAIQVYVADATNSLILYLDEADFDGDENGVTYGNVILKTGVADASDPGDVGYSTATWSTFAEDVQIGIDSIEPGGIGVTGNLLTQSNIVLEGATADAHETIITATDATADRTITLPDATGTVLLTDGDGSSLTSVDAATLDSLDSTQFLRSDAADSFSQQIDGTTLELAGGVTYDPPGSGGSDTATDVGLALHSGARVVMGESGYIRTIIDATASQPLQFGQSATGYFAGSEIYGGSQGVKLFYNTSSKLQTLTGGVSVTGDITVSGTVDGRDVAADGTKLDGIEAGADVTDATNVNAAGAAIFSTTPTANITDGTSGQVLTTNGSGGLSFTTVSGGGGISNVVEDTTPQLGGDLQSNGNDIDLADNDKLIAGTGGDLEIYHDGTNSYIDNNTGALYIRNNVDADVGGDIYLQAKSGETSIRLLDDQGIYLYYDNSLRMTFVSSTTNSYVPIRLLDNNALQFQEDTVNGSNVLSLASAASLTADRTITLPDATGTVALTSDIPTVGTIASQAADSVDIDGGAIDGVTLGTNTAITEAQIDNINIDGFTIEATSATFGLLIKANGQSVARIQSSSQGQGGGLYLYQDNPSITFEGPTPDANETTLAVTDPTADRTITLPDATGTVALFESGDLTLEGALVEKVYNLTGTALDPSNGTLQYKTLSANTTFTESFVDGESITLMIDDGSSYTVTWPTMTWASGSAPTLATTC